MPGHLLLAATIAAASAQHWIADSNTAMAITGDVTFTPTRIAFQNGRALPIRRESRGTYETYRVLSRSNPVLQNGNTVCGPSAPSYLTVRYGHDRSSTETAVYVVFYTGAKPPHRFEDPSNLCATFTYSMKPVQTAVALSH